MDALIFIPLVFSMVLCVIIYFGQQKEIRQLVSRLRQAEDSSDRFEDLCCEYAANDRLRQTVFDVLSDIRSAPAPKQRFFRVHRARRSWGYVYLMCINNEYHKIGRAQDVKDRVGALQTGTPYKIEALHMIGCHHAPRLEMILQNRYAHRWITGEWFKLLPEEIAEFCTISSPVTLADLDRIEGIEA